MYCSNRGSPGPSEKVATPATECEVELLEGRRIVSNELKTKRRARENRVNENRREEGERETFTKAPSTGLVRKTISTGAEKFDVRAPRESGGEDNAHIPVLLNQGQGNATKVNTAVRAAAQRTEDHGGGFGGANTKGEANTPGMHSVEGHLKVSLGSGENDEVTGVTEGVRRSEGNSNGRAKSDSKTVNQQIEKKGRKNSASRNARVDLGCRDRATKTYKPTWEGLSCVNQVLENFEGAGCERNGAARVKRSRVTIALDDRDDEAGLPRGWNHCEAPNGKQEMTPPRE